jgi:hypothetical protein
MKKFATLAAVSALVASASLAHAGGANVVSAEDQPVVVVTNNNTSLGGLTPTQKTVLGLGAAIAVAAALSSGSH